MKSMETRSREVRGAQRVYSNRIRTDRPKRTNRPKRKTIISLIIHKKNKSTKKNKPTEKDDNRFFGFNPFVNNI